MKLSEPISVSFIFDHEKKRVEPKALVWKGRLYGVKKIGFHHKFRQGRTLFHVFSVVAGSLFFRIVLDTENLHWKLEEIADNL